MTENEKREFDHLLGGIKLIIKMHYDTPPHGRFGLPQFQIEAVMALVKQLEAQEKELNLLKIQVNLQKDQSAVLDQWIEPPNDFQTRLVASEQSEDIPREKQ